MIDRPHRSNVIFVSITVVLRLAVGMRVIAKRTLREFWECPEYGDAQVPLEAWYREATNASWLDRWRLKPSIELLAFLKKVGLFSILRATSTA
jgi:hypothetical protein